MEIDITTFVTNSDPSEFSASAAELGQQAGQITWRNAIAQSESSPLLVTDEQIAALRDYIKDFGAWTESKIATWSKQECNALFIQLISGDLREIENLCQDDRGKIDWHKAQELAEAGTIGGNIYPDADRTHFYFYLGH